MILFYLIAVALLLICLLIVVPGLLRSKSDAGKKSENHNLAILKERLEELRQKKENAEIDQQEFEEARADLELQLTNDLQTFNTEESQKQNHSIRSQWLGFVALIGLPMISGLLYLSLGAPQALTPSEAPQTNAHAAPSSDGSTEPMDIQAMVTGLAKRLETNPGDTEGWLMLGRSYMVLQQYQKAADAFEELGALVGNIPEVLVRRADALAMTQDGSLAGEPIRLVNLALQQDPNHPQSLWMAATFAHQTGDLEKSLEFYRRVEPLLEGESKTQVQRIIQSFSAQDTDTQAETQTTTQEQPISVAVEVSLGEALQAEAKPNDMVFIFAKAVQGPPMPLAVVRKTVKDLPVTVSLNDNQSMMPQLKLSQFDEVIIGARISKSGQPIAQSGDLEGESEPIRTTQPETVKVEINRTVP